MSKRKTKRIRKSAARPASRTVPAAPAGPLLFKTLLHGASMHGGSLQWSLPRDGKPGDWHEVEGEISLCNRGLHLTDDPAQWWEAGCVVFVAEGDGILGSCDAEHDRKVVCRRARLIREATVDELTALRIYSSGAHEATPGKVSVASDSATVEAWDSATVRAWGSATVRASDSATVEASGSATVVSWWGKPGVKLIPKSRAVWVERGNNDAVPLLHSAPESEFTP